MNEEQYLGMDICEHAIPSAGGLDGIQFDLFKPSLHHSKS